MRDRAKRGDVTFHDISQADLLLFLRDELHPDDPLNQFHGWYPSTLMFSVNRYTPFELFARSQSKKYFQQVKTALGIETKEQLEKLLEDFKTGSRQLPRFGFRGVGIGHLLGLELIATRP